MPQPAIRVKNLSKLYRIGTRQNHADTLRERITHALAYPFRNLFGRNGAKSIGHSAEGQTPNGRESRARGAESSAIPSPRRGEGQASESRRAGSEGESLWHSALRPKPSASAMTKREVDKKFDEIVDFAEIEAFIDTPVKRYSSGMYTRLAFPDAALLGWKQLAERLDMH